MPSVMYLLRLYCCNFQHFVALPMDKMRVDLTSIVRYIFLELDFYLKLQKKAENCLYISVINKKWYYQPQGYSGHFIYRTANLPAIIRAAKHFAYSRHRFSRSQLIK